MAEKEVACGCCGYDAEAVECEARKIWEFYEDKVILFHSGRHKYTAKEKTVDIKEAAAIFFAKIQLLSHRSFLINICVPC